MRPLLAALLLVMFAGCGSGSDADEQQTVRVFAAASLTEAFTTLAHRFEAEHPDARVVLNFGPSSGLAQQIDSGAPADVFASASTSTMDDVVAAGAAKQPVTFAVNSMQIAVPPGNPADIHTVADLTKPGMKVAVCQPQVPCGAVAGEVFGRAGARVEPVTEEVDVKSVLTKVQLGEVDAGLVYVTDVRAAGDKVQGIRIPDRLNATTTYPIAVLTAAEDVSAAEQFVDLVRSAQGAEVLGKAGFGNP